MTREAHGREFAQVSALLDRLEGFVEDREVVQVADIVDALGRDAFATALLLLGLLALSPLGDIPGAPTIMGLGIVIIAAEMALGRDTLWLPDLLAKRSVKAARLGRIITPLRKVLKLLGKVFRPRLTGLTQGVFARVIAAICGLLALTLPPLEVVPFGATIPSSIITILAMGLVSRDGLLVLLSFALIAGAAY
ncbi:MAG: ABC-type transport system, permease component, partial [Porphyrobacter sp. HL-46]